MQIPTKSYARQYREIWPEVVAEIERVFFEDDPILGAALDRFEERLARHHGVRSAIGVGSGTDAAILLLRALRIGDGAEVVTCAHTFPGVASAILQAGARPVLVDADPASGLLDPARVEAALTPRTAAILAVHLYGHPVDLDAIGAIAQRRGLRLLEDAAQAHGAHWRGRPVGGAGTAAILSFHPSKNLGAFGDGGAVLTDDAALAERLRTARNLGKRGKYEFACVAPNSKLDTLQAAILAVKLRHLDEWVERRRKLAAIYRRELDGVGDLALPFEDPRARHAYHLFVVRSERRDALREHLAAHGIGSGLHYPVATHRQPAFAAQLGAASFPVAEAFARSVVSLPLSHEHEASEIEHVAGAVRAFFAGAA